MRRGALAVLSGGLALTVLFLTGGSAEEPARTSFGVAPQRDGAAAAIAGRF